jgi:hypothetical protein
LTEAIELDRKIQEEKAKREREEAERYRAEFERQHFAPMPRMSVNRMSQNAKVNGHQADCADIFMAGNNDIFADQQTPNNGTKTATAPQDVSNDATWDIPEDAERATPSEFSKQHKSQAEPSIPGAQNATFNMPAFDSFGLGPREGGN